MKLMTVEMTHEGGTDCARCSTGEIPPAEAFDRLIRVLVETRRTMEPSSSQTPPVLITVPPQVDGTAWQRSIEAGCSLVLNSAIAGPADSASGCLMWISFRRTCRT